MLALNTKIEALPITFREVLAREGITVLRPAQEKSLLAGLLDCKSILVCTPTASGKTLIAELAAAHTILNRHAKAVYIAPLVALASEKYREFNRKFKGLWKTALSVGDLDSSDNHLADSDFIVCTSEKLDSLVRHGAHWLAQIQLLIVDEIHLLNDPGRGPTLEVLITLIRHIIPNAQILGLSATIGNPEELAAWLDASLVQDDWRPVPLHKGVCVGGKVVFG